MTTSKPKPILTATLLPIFGLLLTPNLEAAPLQAVDHLPDAVFRDVDYTSSQVAGHPHQRFTLFRPQREIQGQGVPVVINVSNSGFTTTLTCLNTTIKPSSVPNFQLMEAGFSIVQASFTASDAKVGTGGCVRYPGYSGNGFFHPPGFVPAGETIPPYSDLNRPMAEKDMVMLMQHLRFNSHMMGLDPWEIALQGRSGGAMIAMWCALGPERGAELFPFPIGQDLMSTRPNASILTAGAVYWRAFQQSLIPGSHFPSIGAGSPWTTAAKKLNDAPANYQLGSSAVIYEDAILNSQQQVYMTYSQAAASTDFFPGSPGGANYPLGSEIDPHSSWSGFAWKARHPQTRLVITKASAIVNGGPQAELISDSGLLILDKIDYLRAETGAFSNVINEGYGEPGNFAIKPMTPVLTGCGEFSATTAPLLSLSLANASSPCIVVEGFSLAPTPLWIGTVGPAIDAYYMLNTNAEGVLRMPFPVGWIAPGETRYYQVWIADPSALSGWSASNTVSVSG